MKRITAGLCGLMVAATGLVSGAERDRHVAEIEMAKVAIAVELLNSHRPEGRYACSRGNPACSGPAKGELGLVLLRNIRTKDGVRALLEVGAFGLDAGLAEDYDCAVATGGPEMKRQLATVSPGSSRTACLVFFERLIRSMSLYKDVEASSLCRTEVELSQQYENLRKIRAVDCEE